MKSFNSIKKHLLSLIGIIIFVIILFKLEIESIWIYIQNANLSYLLFSLLLIFPIIFLRALRWQKLVNLTSKEQQLPLKNSYNMYWIGIFWSSITPGKVGDFIKALYLKKRNFALNLSIFSIVIDRLFDIAMLLILTGLGMFLFLNIFKSALFYLTIISLVTLTIIFFIWHDKFNFKKIIKKIMYFVVPTKYKNKVSLNITDFKKYLITLSQKNLWFSTFISFMAWLIYFFQIYLLALAINIPINFFYLSICITISSVLSMLPITVSGIGTRDLTLVILFAQLGINKESAIALSLMILFLFIINAIVGWLHSFFEPVISKTLTQSISNESTPY